MEKIYEVIKAHDHMELASIANTERDTLSRYSEIMDRPLNMAAREGCIDCCATLVAAGAPVGHGSIDDIGVFSALFVAAGADKLECFKWLAEHGFPMDPTPCSCEFTPFTYAIYKSSRSVFDYLIDRVDVNFSAPRGYPPLTVALLHASDAIYYANRLLEKGADVHGKDQNGNILFKNSNGEINSIRWHVPFTAAAAKGHVEIMKALVEKGVDVHVKGFDRDAMACAKMTQAQAAINCLKELGY